MSHGKREKLKIRKLNGKQLKLFIIGVGKNMLRTETTNSNDKANERHCTHKMNILTYIKDRF